MLVAMCNARASSGGIDGAREACLRRFAEYMPHRYALIMRLIYEAVAPLFRNLSEVDLGKVLKYSNPPGAGDYSSEGSGEVGSGSRIEEVINEKSGSGSGSGFPDK